MGIGPDPESDPVGAAMPDEVPLVSVTILRGLSVQDTVGRADRVTISGVVTAEGHPLQVMVDSA